jgi:hypothetical protein
MIDVGQWLLGAVGMVALIGVGAWVAWRVERWANPPPPPLPQEILDAAAGLPPADDDALEAAKRRHPTHRPRKDPT